MTQAKLTSGDLNGYGGFLGGNDGTMVLEVGPAGAKVTALSIDATGQLTDKNGKALGNRILFSGTYSNVAVIDITSVITSAYDLYEIELYEAIVRTNSSDIQMRGSIDNGATFLTGQYAGRIASNAGTVTGFNQAGVPGITLAGAASSTGGAAFSIKLSSNITTPRASWIGGYWYSPGVVDIPVSGSVLFNTPSAINALRFVASAGNIDAKVIIKGVGK